jgi:IS5 family transposase
MRPRLWNPPVELSAAEQKVVKRIKRAKLFVFLRQVRHELFNEAFQGELATLYDDKAKGHPPIAPAQLCLTMILQAYTGASDDEAIEALQMDRRWQLVLDCMDSEDAPFSKGTLVEFRSALIAKELDRRLVERTVELAQSRRGMSSRSLRAALDSSPLWGAGRVEDTYNLLGHALRKALSVIARQQGRELTDVATEAGASLVAGSSLKAALDLNWDDPQERHTALMLTLQALSQAERWIADQSSDSVAQTEAVTAALSVAHQVQTQDVETTATGALQLRQGVAKDRRISVEDPQMRHGRKSRSTLVNGYKRHLLHDLDSGLVPVVGITPANAPEATVTDAIEQDLQSQQWTLRELHIDRAYLSSKLVQQRSEELTIYCKAWSVQTRPGQFAKTAFVLDWQQQTLTCPNQVSVPLRLGKTVKFPGKHCDSCLLKAQCTTSKSGRSVSIHPDEPLLEELRHRQTTPQGRAQLRQRVAVEHSLAHFGHWQGDTARYLGLRKNLFDLRRMALVHNLHVIARTPTQPQQQIS